MTKEQFRALTLDDLRKMTALEIWQFIFDYFHSNSLTYADSDLYFARDKNLASMEDEEEAWRYALSIYDYYCQWA